MESLEVMFKWLVLGRRIVMATIFEEFRFT